MMMIDGMMKEDVKVKHHGKWHKDKNKGRDHDDRYDD
jgi:cytochrome b subunit of formate dehydrogenase